MTTAFRNKLDSIMTEIGYRQVTDGKKDEEIIALIETEIINLNDIDIDEPYELIKYDIKDAFYQKQWVNIDHLISDDKLEKLYNLLCEYKREKER